MVKQRGAAMVENEWRIENPGGSQRVIVTKDLPGEHWLEVLTAADCRVEICTSDTILTRMQIIDAIGNSCDGVIGQLTEAWGEELFIILNAAGGKVYSNYAVGYNNIDIEAATAAGIAVGNTPGVLTETTAEMAVALTLAAARRVCEAERFLRAGRYQGWLPNLFVGELLEGKTVGIIGAGRIGSAYAMMMVKAHNMNVLYCDVNANVELEKAVAAYSEFNQGQGGMPLRCSRCLNVEDLLQQADCVSVHTVLDDSTYHLIDADRLVMMKENAILVNTSRGLVIDEAALVAHARTHPDFRAGLDVFEHEPVLADGLTELDNIVALPHIGSATQWTRTGMASLAACNVAAVLHGYPVWNKDDVLEYLSFPVPQAVPSIINAEALGLAMLP
jgi:hydroxypyruvate reductase 1